MLKRTDKARLGGLLAIGLPATPAEPGPMHGKARSGLKPRLVIVIPLSSHLFG